MREKVTYYKNLEKLDQIPHTIELDNFNYLIDNTSVFTNNKLKSYKSLEALAISLS